MAFAWKVLVPISLANLMATGLVSTMTADLPAGASRSLVVFGAFAVANLLLGLATVWLFAWWRKHGSRPVINFETGKVAATASVEGRA
jgi:hypothetical protein